MIKDLFNVMLPQFCLLIFIFIQIFLSIFVGQKFYKPARFVSLVGIALSILLLSTVQIEPQYFAFRHAIMSDSYTLLFHFIILLCGFFTTLILGNLIDSNKDKSYTINAMLLTSLLGAMNVVSANDFLTLFISLELLSFPLYFMIASARGYYSKEACFKYLITSAISTGVFLFGVSYLYGITSSLNFNEIYEIIISEQHSPLFGIAGVLIVLGLISKLSIFPFANWVIDVYKGCETSVLAFLSTVPKLALFGILCRLIIFPLGRTVELTLVIISLSLLTAFWANTLALKTKNVKSIFACSTAANSSYVLFVAGIVLVYNVSAVIFYLLCYVFMNISAFAFLNIVESNKKRFSLVDFEGLYKTNPIVVLAYVISIIALAGIPLTSGFVAKIYLFSAIVHSGLVFLPFLIVLILLTVVALYYYLKLITPLFKTSESDALKVSYSQKLVLFITALATVVIGIYPEKLIEICRYIAYNI